MFEVLQSVLKPEMIQGIYSTTSPHLFDPLATMHVALSTTSKNNRGVHQNQGIAFYSIAQIRTPRERRSHSARVPAMLRRAPRHHRPINFHGGKSTAISDHSLHTARQLRRHFARVTARVRTRVERFGCRATVSFELFK